MTSALPLGGCNSKVLEAYTCLGKWRWDFSCSRVWKHDSAGTRSLHDIGRCQIGRERRDATRPGRGGRNRAERTIFNRRRTGDLVHHVVVEVAVGITIEIALVRGRHAAILSDGQGILVVLLVVVMVHVGTEIVVGGVLLQGVAVGAALAV